MNADRFTTAMGHAERDASASIRPKVPHDITFRDLQPYGLFIPGLPNLIPPHGDESLWEIIEDFKYIAPDGTVVERSAGEKTDLASTPRIAKFIFGGPGKETAAAVVHDEGYASPNEKRFNILVGDWWVPPREWWDNRFLNIMKMCKTNRVKRHVFHFFVRSCGWLPWWRSSGRE